LTQGAAPEQRAAGSCRADLDRAVAEGERSESRQPSARITPNRRAAPLLPHPPLRRRAQISQLGRATSIGCLLLQSPRRSIHAVGCSTAGQSWSSLVGLRILKRATPRGQRRRSTA
jgi:hypothetical protein